LAAITPLRNENQLAIPQISTSVKKDAIPITSQRFHDQRRYQRFPGLLGPRSGSSSRRVRRPSRWTARVRCSLATVGTPPLSRPPR